MFTRFSEYPLCRHTKANGRLCQSPAVTGSAFCHFHQRAPRAARATGPGFSTHNLHPLRNAQTILQAVSMVLSGIASNRIDPKSAGKMLYALQIASSMAAKTPTE